MQELTETLELLVQQGRYIEARNRTSKIDLSTASLRVKQLHAIALSKSGLPKAALAFLEPVYKQNPEDAETAGILGGIYKSIFRIDQDTSYAVLSRDTYLKNYQKTGALYTGINAATMSVISGQSHHGREIAKELLAKLGHDESDFWALTTRAESALLMKDRASCIELFLKARQMAGNDWGRISSVYNQLWLLNHFIPVPNEVLKSFSPPSVVAFTGHMIDHPSRMSSRFPAYAEEKVKAELVNSIHAINARIGYCSLACGGDILFAEAMEEAGGELNLWLPFSKEDFLETSVRFAGDGWVQRFERLISRWPVTYLTRQPYGGHDDLFIFLSQVIFGSAVIRASANLVEPWLLTVQSVVDAQRKLGGTRDATSVWPYPTRHVNINPDPFIVAGRHVQIPDAPKPTFTPVPDRPVLFVLVADLPGVDQSKQEKIWKEVLEKDAVTPLTLHMGTQLIAGFKSIKGTEELLKALIHDINPAYRDRLRVSLYASSYFIESAGEETWKLSASATERLLGLHSLVVSGVFAFARFASVLSLDTKRYGLDYAGIVTVPGEEETIDMYAVSLKLPV